MGWNFGLVKANKEWFKKETGVLLPVKGEWGEVFVSYDPHNLCAHIFLVITKNGIITENLFVLCNRIIKKAE
jgi:hypothetical protein